VREFWHVACFVSCEHYATETTIMTSFSPELSLHWLRGHAEDASDDKPALEQRDVPSRSQQEALDALAERVNAARCIV
jgi:hypothetical protein